MTVMGMIVLGTSFAASPKFTQCSVWCSREHQLIAECWLRDQSVTPMGMSEIAKDCVQISNKLNRDGRYFVIAPYIY